ncbi:putative quinol monooxygenase [Croceicoccus sp. Ery5]|uniref:putative quinol monooxygenase n=1 Tax=Croceicoccus sp. Ery5 TaxID=1703340 RepID=UPI001E456593|nr:antibiotic biosynthesis monooxygenase [Croceicoccus sp. Ery5]
MNANGENAGECEICLVARLVPKTGQAAALADAVLSIVDDVLQEDGCIAYIPHVAKGGTGGTGATGEVIMYEVWANQATLDAHAAGPNLGRLVIRFDELLAEPLQLEVLQRIG